MKTDVKKARQATYAFVSEAFGPGRGFGGADFENARARLHQFRDCEPLAGGRKVNGVSIDFVSPSFWHACCAVLYRWALSRSTQSGHYGLLAYRGANESLAPLANSLALPDRVGSPQESATRGL